MLIIKLISRKEISENEGIRDEYEIKLKMVVKDLKITFNNYEMWDELKSAKP